MVGGGNLMATPKHEGGIDLEGAAELWPTPRTTDEAAGRGAIQSGTTFYRPSKEWDAGEKVGQANLSDVTEQWVTPAARDYKGANSEIHVTEIGNGRKRMDQLSNQVEHSFLPARQTGSDGPPSSESGPTSRRRLNTKFVEWLQGLPEDFTSPEPINSEALATWLYRSRAHLLSLSCSKDLNGGNRWQR